MIVVFNGHKPFWSCPKPLLQTRKWLFCSLIKALHLCRRGPAFKWVMGFRNCFSFVHNLGDLSRLKPPSYCSIM